MNDLISRQAAIDAVCKYCEYYYNENVIQSIKEIPSADVQILSRLLAELTHKERTDRYHVWTTHEVKQWIADKITEMKNDG